MKMPLTWLHVRWPREVSHDHLVAMWRIMATTSSSPLVVEAVGSAGSVTHRIGIPRDRAGALTRQLRSALPGLAIGPQPSSPRTLDRAVSLRLSTRRRMVRLDPDGSVGRALLAALSATGRDEVLVLQWVLGRSVRPEAVPSQLGQLTHESWYAELLALPFGTKKADGEQRNALAAKRAEPGWQAAGRIGVRAETDARRYQLVRGVINALRLAEAPSVTLLVRRTRPPLVAQATRPWHWPMRLNTSELATVSSWPVLSTVDLPIERSGSRLIPPSRLIPCRGRVVAHATYPGRDRPLALSLSGSMRHAHILGPTGVGKSTLLLNLITQDMAAGRSVVVIEPKGDLIADVLARVPVERINDVVLLDPADSTFPVGLNPLAPRGWPPELLADHLLSVIRRLSPSWGPRLEQLLHASFLTLALTPGTTLVALPFLLTDDNYRRRITAKIHDPVALTPYWQAFETWSPAERATAIAPVMNRLLPFLQRPQLRAVLGQSQPRFDIRQVFTERKIMLVDLAKGLLGPETAALLGALVVSQLWQATLSRSAIDPARRHPVFVTIDEFQDYLTLPTDLADALGQARGLGVSFALAHQHLHQLDAPTRSAVLANARNRVAFQLAHDDARTLATAGPGPEAEDFSSLGAFQCYVQLVAGDAVQPWTSARTLPPPEATADPAVVRAESRQRYGTPRAEVDAEVERLVMGNRGGGGDDMAPRPRRDTRGGRS
jgi:hypothetical protein